MGWYAFLLRHFVRPFLPLKYPGRRLTGLNFDGEPAAGFYAPGAARYLDSQDRAYKLRLSKLALDVHDASGGAVIDRLQCIYDEIYVDEVQDLGGFDLDVMERCFVPRSTSRWVGDMRQALLSTNVRDPRHRQYRFASLIEWFRVQEKAKRLTIEQRPGDVPVEPAHRRLLGHGHCQQPPVQPDRVEVDRDSRAQRPVRRGAG